MVEKIKSLLWFSAKVFLAGAVINLVLGILPANVGGWLAQVQANPKALLGGNNA